MSQHRVGIIVGSLSRQSINRRLANALIGLAPPTLEFIDAPIGDLPLYNYDLDNEPPEAVRIFKDRVSGADALLFVTPEYNRSIPGALKNAIDWGTRPRITNVFARKPSGVIGASLGMIGTAIAQQNLHSILNFCDAPQMTAPEAFIHYQHGLVTDDGEVTVESTREFLQLYMTRFAAFVAERVRARAIT